jgi:hypothetical protein
MWLTARDVTGNFPSYQMMSLKKNFHFRHISCCQPHRKVMNSRDCSPKYPLIDGMQQLPACDAFCDEKLQKTSNFRNNKKVYAS